TAPPLLSREGLAHATVHRNDAAGRPGRAVGREPQRRLGDILATDGRLEQVALAVEVLEAVRGDAVRAGALLAHSVRPQARILEDGVGVDDVHPDAVLA